MAYTFGAGVINNTRVSVADAVVVNNSVSSVAGARKLGGGGLFVILGGTMVVDNTSLAVTGSTIVNNTSGQYTFTALSTRRTRDCTLTLTSCVFVHAAAGTGGGVMITTVGDAPTAANCSYPPTYWPYRYNLTTVIANSVIANNSANCPTCTGGGVYFGVSGQLDIVNCTISDNTAGQFGGGLQIGALGSLQSSCSLALSLTSVWASMGERGRKE